MGILGNIADLSVDEKKSTEGVPLELGRGRTLWVRQAGGHNRAMIWEAAEVAERLADELEGLEPRERDYVTHRAITAELLVARWAGFKDEKGKPLDYTPAAGLELFSASPDTLSAVQDLSTSGDAYRLERDKKKLRK